MKYRSIKEIFNTTPEERVVEVFVSLFGSAGEKMAAEFAEKYPDRYRKMVNSEIEHRRKIIETKEKEKEKRWWRLW